MTEGTSTPPQSEDAPATAAPKPAVARTIGERLLAGRERSGLSIPAAAEKLHLDPKVIEALESDRFTELGAPVYVRGHLKRYAEFVGENAVELINSYNARETHAPPPDLTQVPHAERRADPRRLVKPALVVGAAGVLLGAVWWVLSGSRPAADTAESVPPTRIVPADSNPVVGSNGSAATPASLSSTSTADLAPEATIAPSRAPATPAAAAATNAATSAATSTASTVAEPAPKHTDTAPARSTRLRLELTGDSWVEIYDARGERLFFDVASAGSVQSVEGRPPLRVVLGNAAGVSVEVDGQRRDIPEGALDGDGARFVVNRSGSLSRAR